MQHIVGVADMKVSSHPEDVLVTYSLGSCIGMTVYDPALRIGGMLHCMLPLSKIDQDKARANPAMFADTGVSLLLKQLYDRGAERRRLIVKLAGAAELLDAKGLFKIGERNYTIARKVLWKNDILIAAEDVGGSKARTMSLQIATGLTKLKSGAEEWEL